MVFLWFTTMQALWRGDLSLGHAFWSHGILYPALASLCATIFAFTLISLKVPTALAAIVYFLPTPYILAALVGAWRSADRYPGPPHLATLAKLAGLLWGTAMIIA